ncbi:MAG: TlpA family protein disulfide reductase [Muribaculaceae bacterium]|nr:TlpA family protein disulfide reductase [Muribaculaceae bacterium]
MNICCKIVVVMSTLLLAGCITDRDGEPSADPVRVGDRLPMFSVAMSDGVVVNMADLEGSPAAVVFFSTTCPDCRRELPKIQQVYEWVSECDQGIKILCIGREESDAVIRKYWGEQGLTVPYSPQSDRGIYNMFATSGIPRLYIVDADLKVRAIYVETLPSATEITDRLKSLVVD